MLNTNKFNNQRGLTLVELVIVIALLTISVGITGDIVLTLVRSYTKNHVATEVEQTANFALLKLEKELKNASSISSSSSSTVQITTSDNNTIDYRLSGGALQRSVGSWSDLNDSSQVSVSCPSGCFTILGNAPQSIRIRMTFSQTTIAGQSDINYNVDSVVVIRGSY